MSQLILNKLRLLLDCFQNVYTPVMMLKLLGKAFQYPQQNPVIKSQNGLVECSWRISVSMVCPFILDTWMPHSFLVLEPSPSCL